MKPNPYIAPGAQVRVVDDRNCPWFFVQNGREFRVNRVSACGKFAMLGGYGADWLHVSRFKPVVRVKMRRRKTVLVVVGDTHYGDLVPGSIIEVDEASVCDHSDFVTFENPKGGFSAGRRA